MAKEVKGPTTILRYSVGLGVKSGMSPMTGTAPTESTVIALLAPEFEKRGYVVTSCSVRSAQNQLSMLRDTSQKNDQC